MYKATCSNCGKECEVPFRPTSGKPVYCRDCFKKFGSQRSDSPRPERTDFRAPDAVSAKLEAMNIKIERILKLLEPKIAPEATEIKTAKAKKKTSVKKR